MPSRSPGPSSSPNASDSPPFKPYPPEAVSPREILHEDDLLEFSGRKLLGQLRRMTMGRGRLVPTADGFSPYIHIDNAASTPTFQPVWNAVRRAWRLSADRQAELIAAVKIQCAGFFGAPADRYDLIFTSNTTEAINVAAKALIPDAAPGASPRRRNRGAQHVCGAQLE